jgi:SAM-dependent methyltransferase
MNHSTMPVWKIVLQNLAPPLAWKAAKFIVNGLPTQGKSMNKSGKQQEENYYNGVYGESVEYRKHYTASQYYFMWCVLVDRLKRDECRAILDIGCGPGQFASLLRDSGIPKYCGLDFSNNAIQMAKTICPEYEFVAASVFDTDIFVRCDYDTIVSMELLEHLNDDIVVLKRIPRGKKFYGTVPNFHDKAHVRHFADCHQVTERYGALFTQFKVDKLLASSIGTKYFLFEGIKS